MNKIIYLKAGIAFLIPFFTTLGASLAPFAIEGAKPPTAVGIVIIVASVMVASLSALGSFVSTSFADHKAEVKAGVGLPVDIPPVQAQITPTTAPKQ